MISRAWLGVAALCVSCASSPSSPVAMAGRATAGGLVGTDDSTHEIAPRDGDKYTVLIFFSSDCHVLRAHDERIRRIAGSYAERGVRFFAIDSEVGASLGRARSEVRRRGYPFPILLDEGGRIAKAYGAEFVGHVVIVDRAGEVVYRGGIDSDRVRLTDDATPYLAQALADLLSGQSPRIAQAKTLGCALRTW